MKNTLSSITKYLQMRILIFLFLLSVSFSLQAQTTCGVNYSTTEGSISISDLNAEHVILKLFNPNWTINYQCVDDCSDPTNISGLSAGIYHLTVNLYDVNWQPICDFTEDVEITGGGSGCTDNDDDGYCQADDCDDNDPSIPTTAGTSCDDGDPTTNNDVIQADGCTCAGTPISGECNPTFVTTGNSITISGWNSPHVIIKVFNPNWTINTQCIDDCNDPTTVSGLSPGTYHLAINLYDASWSAICEITEDFVITGESPDLPDLDLADFQAPSSGTLGSVVNFTVDLINDGTSIVEENYVIRAYLSTNTSVGNGDTEVGQITTGSTPIGIIQDVPGAITIPSNFTPGSYFLILSVDDDDVILETTNGNNFIRRSFTVEENSQSEECAFFRTYGPYPSANIEDELTGCSVEEVGDQFVINCTSRATFTTPRTQRRVVLTTESNGDLASVTDELETLPPTNAFNEFSTTVENGEMIFIQQDVNSGDIIFSRVIVPNIDPDLTAFEVTNARIYRVPGGLLANGTLIAQNPSGEFSFLYYSFKFNPTGNFDFQNFYDSSVLLSFSSTVDLLYADNNGYLLDFFEPDASSFSFIQFDRNGALLWKTNYTGDLPSNSKGKIEVSADGRFVYVVNRNNGRAFLDKVRRFDGFKVYKLNLGDVLSPDGPFTLNEDVKSFILTPDGGVVVGYDYTIPGLNEGGYEYGKVDGGGNLVWSLDLGFQYGLIPQIMTADGGFLFVNPNIGTDQITVLKTTSTGDRLPICDSAPPIDEIDLPCDLSYTIENGTINIAGLGLNAGHVIVKLFDPNWQTVFTCTDNCGDLISIDGLGDGIYHLTVNLYDNNWQPTCQSTDDIPSGSALRTELDNGELVLDQLRGIVLDKVFPIPASEQINITISAKEASTIQAEIFDGQGRIIELKTIDLLEGSNRFRWDIDQLPSGMYQILFKTANRHTPIRFIKQRL